MKHIKDESIFQGIKEFTRDDGSSVRVQRGSGAGTEYYHRAVGEHAFTLIGSSSTRYSTSLVAHDAIVERLLAD